MLFGVMPDRTNAAGVQLQSPGARSTPWVDALTPITYPTGFYTVIVEPRWGSSGVLLSRSQGALRDPGLWNSTALRLVCLQLFDVVATVRRCCSRCNRMTPLKSYGAVALVWCCCACMVLLRLYGVREVVWCRCVFWCYAGPDERQRRSTSKPRGAQHTLGRRPHIHYVPNEVLHRHC